MRSCPRHVFVFVSLALTASSIAHAQPAADPPPETAPPPPAASTVVVPPPSTPPPPPSTLTPPTPPAAAPEATTKWYDSVALDAFVDAYASLNWNGPEPQTPTNGVGGNRLRAFDVSEGFALHWVGLNASVAPAPVGGTVSLRFGPSAPLYAGADTSYGLEYVKQAYASWKPGGKDSSITLDFGKYDQPFGSEVADTQLDMNYSRSGLYWFAQPLFFTGLRFDWAASDAVDLKLFAMNGWNNSVDTNRGKSFGIQLAVKPTSTILVAAGYVGGPEQAATSFVDCAPGTALDAQSGACNPSPGAAGGTGVARVPGAPSRLKQLGDLVVDATFDKLRLLLNANYGAEDLGEITANWYGVNLAAGYTFDDAWSLALRGEYYGDPDGYTTATALKGTKLVDGTLTLGYAPSTHLLLRLEQRLDYLTSDGDAAKFQKGLDGSSHTQMTTTLGVVVKTN